MKARGHKGAELAVLLTVLLTVLVAAWAFAATGPAADGSPLGARVTVISAAAAQPAGGTSGTVMHEIDDPATGNQWLLVRDADDPGGPGRMVLAVPGLTPGLRAGLTVPDRSGSIRTPAARASLLPVIRAGDRVVVEENTPVVEARLEAVALAPAFTGSILKVRLVIGGKVVQAVALGPGRAAFANQIGARP